MRFPLVAWIAASVLVVGIADVSAQAKKDQPETPSTGQSERPKDPKHNEPESSSHNADKPTKQSGEPQRPADRAKPPATEKKDPG